MDNPTQAILERSSATETGLLQLARAADAAQHYLVGDGVAVLHGGRDTGGAFDLCLVEAMPGGGPPLHTHAQTEVFTVLSGRLQVLSFFEGGSGLETVEGGPGDSFVVPGGTPHCFRAPQGEESAHFTAFLTPGGLGDFFPDAGYLLTAENRSALLAAPPDIPRVMAAAQRHGVAVWDPQATWTGAGTRHLPASQGAQRQLAGELIREAAVLEPGGELMLLDCISQPGAMVPLHSHADQEVFLVTAGEYEFSTRDSAGAELRLHAPAGTAVLIPAHAPHGFCNVAPGPSRALAFFNGTAHRGFFAAAGRPVTDREALAGVPFALDMDELGAVVATALRHGLAF
jgi:quercetin dioxygenase-like cupin family protein